MRFNTWLLLSLLTGPSAAADISVFGLDLGKPFLLPECAITSWERRNSYNFSTNTVCYRRVESVGSNVGKPFSRADDYVDIIWPRGSEPQTAKYNSVTAFIIDGNLEQVVFGTYGLDAQARDIKILTDKFGPPSKGGPTIGQNGYGATFQVIHAEWNLDGVSVEYDSAGGAVRILTSKAIETEKAQRDRINASRQKL